MNETKQNQHTPGPWRSRELGSEGARVLPDYGDVRERGKVIADVRGRDTLTDFANAHLIAAAPELLEACEKCIADVNFGAIWDEATGKNTEWFKVMRAAVRKALGD